MLTAEFTQAVDAHPSESNPAHLPVSGPPWAQCIQKAIPQYLTFSTLHLLRALYFVADELGLAAGKRYVSASIRVCANRAAPVNSEGQSATETKSQTAS